MIYAILEAKAAPEIPHLGTSNKFKGILIAKEMKAAKVPISGLPLPAKSALIVFAPPKAIMLGSNILQLLPEKAKNFRSKYPVKLLPLS